jgi:hypothetical protein
MKGSRVLQELYIKEFYIQTGSSGQGKCKAAYYKKYRRDCFNHNNSRDNFK